MAALATTYQEYDIPLVTLTLQRIQLGGITEAFLGKAMLDLRFHR